MLENTTVTKRFLRYVQIDTQSDPQSTANPSTEKQKDLGRLLVEELREIGITDAELDEFGYIYATIPANTEKTNVPVLCLCAHMDTSPDVTGKDVKPLTHHDWDGSDIVCTIRLATTSLPPAEQPCSEPTTKRAWPKSWPLPN
jgi:tripeptide aminopeptidase